MGIRLVRQASLIDHETTEKVLVDLKQQRNKHACLVHGNKTTNLCIAFCSFFEDSLDTTA